jgi:hypothetical protein
MHSGKRRFGIFGVLATMALLCLTSGCVATPVWERGDLARQEMAWEVNPGLSAYRHHAQFSKEAAFGTVGVGGGGCGCN